MMIAYRKFVLVVAVVLLSLAALVKYGLAQKTASDTVATAKSHLNDDGKLQFLRQNMYVVQFRCGPPQPRFYSMKELKHELNVKDAVLCSNCKPHGAVLHRCDKYTGSCEGAKECGVVQDEEVVLHFLDLNTGLKKELTAKNHTACGCANQSEQKKPK